MNDNIFLKPINKQFEFDENVATVFDDMLNRSVPFYQQVLALTGYLISVNTEAWNIITDLGCSTATTLLHIEKMTAHPLKLIGIDNSEAMLHQARHKIAAYGSKIELLKGDFNQSPIPRSHVIIANYTLQFVRPLQREKLITKIFDALEKDSFFIFSEKIIYEDKVLNKQMIDNYYAFKKTQGYSDYEISQKREALENVLVPYTEEENRQMVMNAGFDYVQTIFKWGNFATFLAKKH